MTDAITQCPDCLATFRVTEAQLLVADGSVRCGACLHVFQAEQYFVSPLLDTTEQLAIAADYWADFESYVLAGTIVDEPVDVVEPLAESTTEPMSFPKVIRIDGSSEIPAGIEAKNEVKAAREDAELMRFYLDYLATHPGVLPLPTGPDDHGAGDDEDREREEETLGSESEQAGQWADALYDEYRLHTSADENSAGTEVASASVIETRITEAQISEVQAPEDLITEDQDHEYLASESSGTENEVFEYPDSATVVSGYDLPLHEDHDFLLQDRRRLFSVRSLKWLPGIALMIAMAFVQYAYFSMGTHAQNPEYRSTYVLVCRYLDCDVPTYENRDELRTRELVIRSHPDLPNALLVDVLLLNSGPFRQLFPELRLDFYDVRGNVVASRIFSANEYLGGEMRGLKMIPAETEVRLSLELIDPGDDALGYQMEAVYL